jgi:hypothetical protein
MVMTIYCQALVEFGRWDATERARLAERGITPLDAEQAGAYSELPVAIDLRIDAPTEADAQARLASALPGDSLVISSVRAVAHRSHTSAAAA